MRGISRVATVVLAGLILAATAACSREQAPSPEPPVEQTIERPVVEEETPVEDSGPRDGAMGAVEVNVNGTPWKYTVVEGDAADDIRGRFNLWWDQLARDGKRLNRQVVIYPGDVLTLVPHDPKNEGSGGRP